MFTIHEMLADVTAPFAGKTLSKETIVALVQDKYPETNAGSILPGDVDDYDRGTSGAPWKQGYAVLFSRVNRGTFKVLAVADRIPATSKGRGNRASGKTQAQLVAEARALLAVVDAPAKLTVPATTVIPATVVKDNKPATK
jgi:hypothetical protein